MAYQYPNKQIFQDGLHITAAEPIDDRSYVPSLSSIFIKGGTTAGASHMLYNKMYAGHLVVVTDTHMLMILKNPAPYMRDTSAGLEVKESNYMDYWEVLGYQTEYEISTNLKPRITKLESYGRDVNVSDGNTGAIAVTNTPNSNGYQQYDIKVKVDNNTIKIGSDNKLNVGKYKLVDIGGADDEILTKYQLWYKAPNSSQYVALSDSATIDIQKDYVLKEVHLCKASYNSSTKEYTETSRPGDENWDTDTNDVYLHFIWNTQTGTGHQTETFLRVEDVIGSDVAQMRADILDISTVKIPNLNTRIANVSQNLNETSAHINSHINSSYVEIKTIISDTSAHINSHINSSYEAMANTLDSVNTTLNNKIDNASTDINSHINSSYEAMANTLDSVNTTLTNKIDNASTDINQRLTESVESLTENINTVNTTLTGKINDTSTDIHHIIDTSYGEIKDRLDTIDSSIEDGDMMYTSAVEDSVKVLTDHGEIKAGTTAATLKEKTLSQIFDLLIFETATPQRQHSASASIAWKSSSPYKNTVDMGVDVPAASATILVQTTVSFTPETWKWTSKDGTQSKAFDVVESNGTTYFYAATSVDEGTSTGTTVRLTDGDPTAYFYGEVALKAGENAKDSLGSETKIDGTYYAKATDRLASYTDRKVTTTSRISTTAAWRVFSNATKLFTTSDAAYNGRNTNPGAYKGSADTNITQNDQFIPTSASTINVFLQWPATTDSQPLYVCVPNTANCKCTITGAYAPALAPSASTDEGRFPSTGATNYLKSGSTSIMRTSSISGTGLSGQGQEGSFLKYEIRPLAGISTLRIIIKRS